MDRKYKIKNWGLRLRINVESLRREDLRKV